MELDIILGKKSSWGVAQPTHIFLEKEVLSWISTWKALMTRCVLIMNTDRPKCTKESR